MQRNVLEVSSSSQAAALIKLQKLAHLDITVAHTNLNFSHGFILTTDFLNVSTEEILENMKAQKVWSLTYNDEAGWSGAENEAPHPDLFDS
ncbi:hypothetical protein TNCT_98961 [Trichonephila clavata]|uniref:Uncharacterized protein n=1 Tax=Trichonephila clavata TaxID=2740835 RepID=A0A8X6I993_TRICU|nr:hypothetical protein TNCT_98961 [Trichonephila clavata]